MQAVTQMSITGGRCCACLSPGRRTSPLGAARNKHLQCVLGKVIRASLEVCWECRALIDKSIAICERLRRASDVLTSQSSESISTLAIVIKVGFDFDFNCSTNKEPFKLQSHEDACQKKCVTSAMPRSSSDPIDTNNPSKNCHRPKLVVIQKKSKTNLQNEMQKISKYNIFFKNIEKVNSKKQSTDVSKKIASSNALCEISCIDSPVIKNEHNLETSSVKTIDKFEVDERTIEVNKLHSNETQPDSFCASETADLIVKSEEGSSFECYSHRSVDTSLSRRIIKSDPEQMLSIETKGVEATAKPTDKCDPGASTLGANENSQSTSKNVKVYSVTVSDEQIRRERDEQKVDESYVNSLFKCESCIVGFENKVFLEEHNDRRHNPKYAYPCDICAERFSHAATASAHRVSHNKRFVCNACGYTHRKAYIVNQHHNKQHGDDLLQYAVCDQNFLEYVGLAESECAVCGKRVLGRAQILAHARTHETSAPESAYCAECDVQFRSNKGYKAHLASAVRHVALDERRYPCDKCDKRFTVACRLRRHYDVEHLKKQITTCDICKKVFNHARSLNRHKLVAHQGMKLPKNKACSICDKSFSSKTILTQHMRTHTGERPYTCDICGDTFRQHASYYTHKRLVHLKLKKSRKS